MKLKASIASLAALLTIAGGIWSLDARWSQASEVESLKQIVSNLNNRLEGKIISDQITAIQNRQWRLKDRYGENVSEFPQSIKEEYRNLEKQKNELIQELKILKGKGNET